VVRERNWLSFQAGEIRVCTSCHGINKLSQTGDPPPTNEPQALRDLLAEWKVQYGGGPTVTPGPSPTPTTAGGGVCSSAIVIERVRLRARYSSNSLSIRGRVTIPPPWQGVAPHINGVRITLAAAFDISVPGGAGWTMSATGKRWRYRDPEGLVGGVRRIDVMDRSAAEPGMLSFAIRLVDAPAVPALGAVDLALRFGAPSECGTAHWNGPGGSSPLCVGNALSLSCR
jgi:hypothetical protein